MTVILALQVRCGAQLPHQPQGRTCGYVAGHGTDHLGVGRCKRHGGNTPNHRTAAVVLQVRQVLAELELISHVSAVNTDGTAPETTEDIGGKRPPGGIVRKDDNARDANGDPEPYPQKSFEHFARRVAAIERRRERDLLEVRIEATKALAAARRQPAPTGEPEFGSPQWKRWCAESPLSHGEIARKFGCHRSYVKQIRDAYGTRAA